MKITAPLVAGLLCGLSLCQPVLAQKTKAQLATEIGTTYPDNTIGAITPAGVRSYEADVINSIMPSAPVVPGNLACFNGTTGLLQDCGSAPATVPLTVGTTPIGSGTTLRVLYDNAGVLGEYSSAQLTALVNLATSSLAGTLPAWPGNTTTFFRGDGSYATLNIGAIGGLGTGVATTLGNAANASGGIVSPTPTRAGDILYWNGTAWVTLAGNNSGTQLLQENASGLPSWVTVSGTGTVTSVTCFGTAITSSGTCTTAATKSDQQTGTSVIAVVTPSQQQSHPSAAKAWGSITASTGVLTGGYGMSNATHTASTGIYVINFSVAFANTNYSCQSQPTGTIPVGSTGVTAFPISSSKTTTSIQINTFSSALANADPAGTLEVHCFGSQ